jgi:hypothetical protein
MSACIVLSDRHRWEVKNWVLYQFFDDLRAAYPSNPKLRAYLEQLEPILYDDVRSNPEDTWVARIYYGVARQIVEGRLATTASSEVRHVYLAAVRELVELFEADGHFVASI